MKNRFHALTALAVLLLISCSPKVYYSPDAELVTVEHQKIAIAPPQVAIVAPRKAHPADIRTQEAIESQNFHRAMYSWLLHRKMQNRLFVDVQDVATTIALLENAGYYEGVSMTTAQLAEVLGVDAVVTVNYALSKPISDVGAVALKVLFGNWNATNHVSVTVALHDRDQEKDIWNYHRRVRGTVGSTPGQLVNQLMRNASRKMPYR